MCLNHRSAIVPKHIWETQEEAHRALTPAAPAKSQLHPHSLAAPWAAQIQAWTGTAPAPADPKLAPLCSRVASTAPAKVLELVKRLPWSNRLLVARAFGGFPSPVDCCISVCIPAFVGNFLPSLPLSEVLPIPQQREHPGIKSLLESVFISTLTSLKGTLQLELYFRNTFGGSVLISKNHSLYRKRDS